jgi:hypothetical protein
VVPVVWRAQAHITGRFMFLSSNLSVFFLIHAPFVLCDSFIFFCGSGAGVVVPVDLRAEAHIAGRFGLSHPTSLSVV